jgi:hypothetical protein
MRAFAAAVAAALAAAAITITGAPAGTSTSGLVGKVMRGPTLPVCVHYRPCQVTASAALTFSRGGKEVARVKSGPTGEYRIALAPGVYAVRPALRHPLWRVLPQTVRVPVGRYAKVNFLIDTGIR